jgi:ferredoxin--NADP+ reductase
VDGISYEAYNPDLQKPVEGIFLAGWARDASTGLVGTARKDGTNAAHAVMQYLDAAAPKATGAMAALAAKAAELQAPVVDKADLTRLEIVEAAQAAERGVAEFKFDSNAEMLAAIGKLPREKSEKQPLAVSY